MSYAQRSISESQKNVKEKGWIDWSLAFEHKKSPLHNARVQEHLEADELSVVEWSPLLNLHPIATSRDQSNAGAASPRQGFLCHVPSSCPTPKEAHGKRCHQLLCHWDLKDELATLSVQGFGLKVCLSGVL